MVKNKVLTKAQTKQALKGDSITNKKRTIEKLEQLFKSVTVSGRGSNLTFDCDGFLGNLIHGNSNPTLYRTAKMVATNLVQLVNDGKDLTSCDDESYSYLTLNKWLERAGLIPVNMKEYEFEKTILDSLNGKPSRDTSELLNVNYPIDLRYYTRPSLEEVLQCNGVIGELSDLLHGYYRNVWGKAMKILIDSFGWEFQTVLLGRGLKPSELTSDLPEDVWDVGSLFKLNEEEIQRLDEFELANKHRFSDIRAFRNSKEYRKFLHDVLKFQYVYTAYEAVKVAGNQSVSAMVPVQTLQERYNDYVLSSLVGKEVGNYFGADKTFPINQNYTKVPYQYKRAISLYHYNSVTSNIFDNMENDFVNMENQPSLLKRLFGMYMVVPAINYIMKVTTGTTMDITSYEASKACWYDGLRQEAKTNDILRQALRLCNEESTDN